MNLCQLVLIVSFALPAAPTEMQPSGLPASLAPDEQALNTAKVPVTGPGLLDFFHKRTPSTENDAAVAALIKQLSDKDATGHAKAQADLIALGPAAVKSLRVVANNIQDLEASARAKECLKYIEGQSGASLLRSAIKVLAALKPEGAAAALIDYYPFADDESVTKELDQALVQVALRNGKVEQALVQALKDDNVSRRSAAAVALCQAGGISVHEQVRPLLKDPKPTVRFQVALALANAYDGDAVPILIDALAELAPAQQKQAEEWLSDLAGDWALKAPQGPDATSRKLRRELWLTWWKNMDGKQLTEEFKSRMLSDEDYAKAQALIKNLDDNGADVRDKASKDLVALGPKVVPLLRQAGQREGKGAPLAVKCADQIDKGAANPLPQAAPRLLSMRRPEGTLETFLAYLPYSESDTAANELTDLIVAVGVRDGKPDPLLLKALEDKVPARRSVAAYAVCRSGTADHLPAVRKLLKDPEIEVRLRTAEALASIHEREAVPVLIALLADLPLPQAFEVEDYLNRLTTAENAPKAPLTSDPASRAKCRDAWAAWWKENGANVDLAKADAAQRTLGLTLVVESQDITNPQRTGRVVELDASGKIRWKIEGMFWPTDAQMLPGNRVLIAEQNGNRVTERDTSGKILWEKNNLPQPFAAQRLRNGNTFIATRNTLYIFDKDGKQVSSFPHVNEYFLAATSFRDGSMAYLNNQGQYHRLDATGKDVKSYLVPFNPNWGINYAELLPNDHVIISAQAGNNLSEFSPDGKKVWEATVAHAGTPYRMSNGQTMAPNANASRIAVLDREGKVVSEMKDLPVRPWVVRRR
jgi:HEAT repeat protein